MKVILDTSIFVNPDSHCFFGKTPDNALTNFLDILSNKKTVSCYIPPSIYEELIKFIKVLPPIDKLTLIIKKPPSSYQISIPALFLYEFIEEMRLRVNKGLRVAEKHARKGIRIGLEKEQTEAADELIKDLRVEYRTALREGIIDSKEDFDLILLAKELDGFLATADNGLIKWAYKLGISCITAQELKEMLS